MSPAKQAALARVNNAETRLKGEGKAWNIANTSQIDIIKSHINDGDSYETAKRKFGEIYDDHESRYKKALQEVFEAHKEYREAP
ncbi:hypothetical protein PQQ87_08365 [Paraburkholderia nemoris]|uniref:hypothetical protein n=1 Tax=Paraburkholderia nemoris TaxID=2793076 RepID=UPI0038BD524A